MRIATAAYPRAAPALVADVADRAARIVPDEVVVHTSGRAPIGVARQWRRPRGADRWSRRRAGLLAAAAATVVYALLSTLYTFPLLFRLDSGIMSSAAPGGDALQQTWIIAWIQHALFTHPTALFDAPIFYPTRGTLAYQDHMLLLAVGLLPLAAVAHNPLVVYNCAVLLSFPLCGLSMYALAAHLCRDRRAAFLAGLIIAFCPYREGHIEHLNLLSAEGIPLMILGFEAARSRGGAWRWGAFGLALLLCITLSLYYAGFTLLGLACYVLLLLVRRRVVIAHGAWRGLWALIAVLPVCAAFVIPYMRTQSSVGDERRLQDIVYFSADVRDFLHAGPQSLLYGWSDALWRIAPLAVHQYLFPGLTALALAIVGVLSERAKDRPVRMARSPLRLQPLRRAAWLRARHLLGGRRRVGADISRAVCAPASIYGATALMLAVLILGPYLRLFGSFTSVPMPYFIVYLLAPGFRGFRDIGRYDGVIMAYLAVAAAYGATTLFARVGIRRPRLVPYALSAVAALLVLEYAVVQYPLQPVLSGARIPPVYRWLAAQPPGVVAELPLCGLRGPFCWEESSYMYYSAYHWHPLINGGGGFFPPGWPQRIAAVNLFPSPRALAALRRLDVLYIVVHPNYPRLRAVQALLAVHPCPITIGGTRLTARLIGHDLVLRVTSDE